jgi:hypothetical protein
MLELTLKLTFIDFDFLFFFGGIGSKLKQHEEKKRSGHGGESCVVHFQIFPSKERDGKWIILLFTKKRKKKKKVYPIILVAVIFLLIDFL